uniref:cellulase n=1 Tax=Ananas comosus var. bracteatus TaxID=296719 RepID=A0A6V7Q248_ANACO|nr:unnamed protein product [Ananas comosus var. bracteatus]
MFSANHWGGSFEINNNGGGDADDDHSRNMDMDRAALSRQLDETQQSWLLGPQESKKKDKYVDLGCVVVKRKLIWWAFWALLVAFIVVGVPIIVVKSIPKKKVAPPPPDQYTNALHKALLFFNSQNSRKNNGIPWRGDSGLKDGSDLTDVKGGLVGGSTTPRDNIKFHFPMAFSMTLLSWDVIKWGTDYLLLTFNSSASTINQSIASVPRPCTLDYPRPVQTASSAPDLAGEVAAALASASIVFSDDAPTRRSSSTAPPPPTSSRATWGTARPTRGGTPTSSPTTIQRVLGPSYMWSAAWMYYAPETRATSRWRPIRPSREERQAFMQILDLSVFSWDNKLPGAELLLTRLRMFLNPGYPYEDTQWLSTTLLGHHEPFRDFDYLITLQAGLIEMNHGSTAPLQYAVNMAFLALRSFAKSQVDYVLGNNPRKMSYLVGYGSNYPKHVAPPRRVDPPRRDQVLVHRRVEVAQLQEREP